ncbi:sugar kinase [Jeongeupia sp. HS-3]|uniref:sugar kinase n=1 Tax=Jeongeupia sp. HS-3 TaxID=1009682 RepID=UPI0019102E7F|nr:sugar kinase [Jeongeupia sp. HS-3]
MLRQTVAVIGECMVELQREGAALTYRFGGDTLNTAVYLSRLVDHARIDVAYVSALGIDTLSDEMLAAWQAEAIATRLVQRLADKLPGMYLIETDARGERSFHYWRNDSAARYWLQGPGVAAVIAALEGADVVYLSGISLAILSPEHRRLLIDVLARCQGRGGRVVFDNNYRPRLWEGTAVAIEAYRQVLALADTALLTLDDEAALYGDADVDTVLARTFALGVREVVIKRGGESCIAATQTERVEVAPAPVERVVDTTAAGDSFGAGYLAARLAGSDLAGAARAGHALAGKVIQHRGAIIPREAM